MTERAELRFINLPAVDSCVKQHDTVQSRKIQIDFRSSAEITFNAFVNGRKLKRNVATDLVAALANTRANCNMHVAGLRAKCLRNPLHGLGGDSPSCSAPTRVDCGDASGYWIDDKDRNAICRPHRHPLVYLLRDDRVAFALPVAKFIGHDHRCGVNLLKCDGGVCLFPQMRVSGSKAMIEPKLVGEDETPQHRIRSQIERRRNAAQAMVTN